MLHRKSDHTSPPALWRTASRHSHCHGLCHTDRASMGSISWVSIELCLPGRTTMWTQILIWILPLVVWLLQKLPSRRESVRDRERIIIDLTIFWTRQKMRTETQRKREWKRQRIILGPLAKSTIVTTSWVETTSHHTHISMNHLHARPLDVSEYKLLGWMLIWVAKIRSW